MTKKLLPAILAILISAVHTGSLPAHAATRAFFPNGDARVLITLQKPSMGAEDTDAERLYQSMNVTPENTFLGPGKAIVTEDRALNFVCAIRSGGITTCSIILNESPRTRISVREDKAEFTIQGEAARAFHDLFVHAEGETFRFESEDHLFAVEASQNVFRVSYGY